MVDARGWATASTTLLSLKSLCGGGVPSSHPSLGLSVFFLFHIRCPMISNQPPAGPPATIQTRVQSAPPARLSEALRRWSTNHRGSSDKSTHTHAGDTRHTAVGTRGCHISHLPYTKHYSHDTRGSGGAAAAAAVARAGGRTRTGRSSDRLGGRCSVCQSRILKIQASLTAHWHDKGADWRGLAHSQKNFTTLSHK